MVLTCTNNQLSLSTNNASMFEQKIKEIKMFGLLFSWLKTRALSVSYTGFAWNLLLIVLGFRQWANRFKLSTDRGDIGRLVAKNKIIERMVDWNEFRLVVNILVNCLIFKWVWAYAFWCWKIISLKGKRYEEWIELGIMFLFGLFKWSPQLLNKATCRELGPHLSNLSGFQF